MIGGIWESGFGIGKSLERAVIRYSSRCNDQEARRREREVRIDRPYESRLSTAEWLVIPNPESPR